MAVDPNLIAEILSLILAIITAYAGSKYKKAKAVLVDISKTLDDTVQALADGKITPEEVQKILADLKKTVHDAGY